MSEERSEQVEPKSAEDSQTKQLEKMVSFALQKRIRCERFCSTLPEQAVSELKGKIRLFFLDTLTISEIKQYIFDVLKLSPQKLIDSILKEKEILLSFPMLKQAPNTEEIKANTVPSPFNQAILEAMETRSGKRVRDQPLEDEPIRKAIMLGEVPMVVLLDQQTKNESQTPDSEKAKEGENGKDKEEDKEEKVDSELEKPAQIEEQNEKFEGKSEKVEGKIEKADEKSEKAGIEQAEGSESPKTQVNEQRSSVVSSETGQKLKRKNKKIKCRFYPDCQRASCTFFHPTKPCLKFPKCVFGVACLYIHPSCRYGAECTRRAICTYTHPKNSFNPKKYSKNQPKNIPQAFKIKPVSLREVVSDLIAQGKKEIQRYHQ